MNTTSNNTSKTDRSCIFRMTSRHIFIAAIALIIAGYVLMSGPGSTDQCFNLEIFSTRRIVIAPILCLAGYLLIILSVIRFHW